MIDTQRIKQLHNIVELIEADLGPGKKSGRWLMWRCPFHDDGTPSLVATADNGRWHCFGCGKSGDVITWMQEHHRLDFVEACERLSKGIVPMVTAVVARPQPTLRVPRGAAWQDKARAFVERAQRSLRDNHAALEYYLKRGLTEATIVEWKLGYNPHGFRDTAQAWGLDPTDYPKGVWLPQGYVIPGIALDNVWYIKIRRPDVTTAGSPKYVSIAGSHAKALYGTDFLRSDKQTLLLVEGEFNALIAYQELAHMVDIVSVGSAANGVAPRWIPYLFHYETILALYDGDEAGRKGLASLKQLSHKVKRVWLPSEAGDLNDFYLAGGKLQQWLSFHLERLQIVPRRKVRHPASAKTDKRRQSWQAEAQRLGRLYWVLYPLSEHNGNLHKLNQQLDKCREWAQKCGVSDVLEATLNASSSFAD